MTESLQEIERLVADLEYAVEQHRGDHNRDTVANRASAHHALLSAITRVVEEREWQPIETAPRDGSWFMICVSDEGYESYEVGRYDPLLTVNYVEVGDNLYRKETRPCYDWTGFNNFHRATHWMPLPEPPRARAALSTAEG